MRLKLAGAAAGVIGLAALAVGLSTAPVDKLGERAPAERPALALVTSLPLIFGEDFSLTSGGSEALQRLEQRYAVQAIGVADAASLKGHRLLLMAHPRAQPAEALVELDQWVRAGGHLLLLADPKLDWPSERPLGDRLRPPPAFADTGLLKHWGLTLEGPPADSEDSTGKLAASSGCRLLQDGLVARCAIGSGLATVIADADLIDSDSEGSDGIDLVLSELERLDSR